jgi:thiamine biosynthesis lipoprotein
MTQEYTFTGRIFGTDYSLGILHDDANIADKLAAEVITLMREYELCCSRFLPESELSILNRTKSLSVSPEFFTVVTEAKKMYDRTSGIFNPLVQVSELGYQHSRDTVGNITPDAIAPNLDYDTDFSAVTFDPTTFHITLGPTQKIDLGGILKGYLAEVIARHICTHGGASGAIINIGGDLATYGHDVGGGPFPCTIYNPITDTDTNPHPLVNQSLVTSGTYKRHWQQHGHTIHHIVDPTSHVNPTETIISASVIHQHGAEAEAFAKVYLVAGAERGLEILKHETYQYYLIAKDGTITTNLTTS